MADLVVVEYIRGAGIHLLHGRVDQNGELHERIFWRGIPQAVDPQEAANLCATRHFRRVEPEERDGL